MKFPELKKYLSAAPAGAYSVYGDDPYLCERALAAFTGLVTFCPELNINIFTGTAAAGEIVEACELLPLGELRVVVVREYKGKDFTAFSAYAAAPNPQCALVLYTPGEKSAPKGLKGFEAVDCSRLESSTLIKWVEGSADIAYDAAKKLCEYCENFMTRISAELAKLTAYAGGRRITAADVEEMVEPEAEYQIYQLSDAAARGNAELAYKIADKCIAARLAPSVLTSGMYSHFRRLLYASVSTGSESEKAAWLNVKPFAVEMATRQAKLFSPVRLKRICDGLRAYELGVKSGKIYDYNAFILAVNVVLSEGKR